MREIQSVKLEGQRIVVTGGSLGIGLAVAQECRRRGAHLSLVARHLDTLEQARATMAPADDSISLHPVDVGDPRQVEGLAHLLSLKFGRVDGLVNCAGLYGPIGRLEETDPGEFTDAVRVNLLGTYYMCRYLLPLMKGSRRGKIVNYSGGGGSTPLPNYSAYASSKAGIIRLTENLALEYAEQGIDANVVAPGFVPTRIHLPTLAAGEKAGRAFFESTRKSMESKEGSPDRAARLTAYLLSSQSDGISGKLISALWDPWDDPAFQETMRQRDFGTLRRIDGRLFREGSG